MVQISLKACHVRIAFKLLNHAFLLVLCGWLPFIKEFIFYTHHLFLFTLHPQLSVLLNSMRKSPESIAVAFNSFYNFYIYISCLQRKVSTGTFHKYLRTQLIHIRFEHINNQVMCGVLSFCSLKRVRKEGRKEGTKEGRKGQKKIR